jgi:hypothetical protein
MVQILSMDVTIALAVIPGVPGASFALLKSDQTHEFSGGFLRLR